MVCIHEINSIGLCSVLPFKLGLCKALWGTNAWYSNICWSASQTVIGLMSEPMFASDASDLVSKRKVVIHCSVIIVSKGHVNFIRKYLLNLLELQVTI